jgi:septal ring factor EnvC (AmiA/AmiB activator)
MATIDEQQTAAIQQLQTQFAAAAARLDTMATQIQQGGDRITATEARYAAGETRLTSLEAGLSKALADFTPVAGRVGELSSAALSFNDRLTALETAVSNYIASAPPPDADRLAAVEQALTAMDARLAGVEQSRARGGGLSSRLTGIEQAIRELNGQTPEGGGNTV